MVTIEEAEGHNNAFPTLDDAMKILDDIENNGGDFGVHMESHGRRRFCVFAVLVFVVTSNIYAPSAHWSW